MGHKLNDDDKSTIMVEIRSMRRRFQPIYIPKGPDSADGAKSMLMRFAYRAYDDIVTMDLLVPVRVSDGFSKYCYAYNGEEDTFIIRDVTSSKADKSRVRRTRPTRRESSIPELALDSGAAPWGRDSNPLQREG